MKPLIQIADDLRTLAAFATDAAISLEEVAAFFGGGTAPNRESTPAPASMPEMRTEQPASYKPTLNHFSEGGRALSKDEKAGIRKDWDTLSPQLRTATNRAALAAKYQCSQLQVSAITRDPEQLKKNLNHRWNRGANEATQKG